LKNYYSILGIKEGASLQEIKKAYKTSVKKWHMANASHENHPFFAYFMRFDNMTWVKEWMEKDSKKTEGD